MSARFNLRGAQAASLPVAAACRDHLHARGKRETFRWVSRSPMFPAGCRKLQAGSLRSPAFDSRGWIFALFLLFTSCHGTHAEPPLAPATIVVYNSTAPESAELAKFYAQKRGIARDHLVALACSTDEEISREEYDRAIAGPLRDVFMKRGWWTVRESAENPPVVTSITIRFVALIKGMPLKIRGAENYPGDKVMEGPIGGKNEASVDSELSLLARFSGPISGAVNNPYFKSYRSIRERTDSPVLLVCRLDAPAAATVRQMIIDAIETEKSGLWGRAYVDGAGNTSGGFELGDQWLAEVAKQVRNVGIPVVYDRAASIFPDGFPMTDCALYYGWYTAGVAGPFTQPGFRFTPGAVAVHIHSFSASTLRDPNASWVAPLLSRGAAAVLGNVYEPYLQLTSHLDIFNDRLVHGFTFAESAYMSLPALSWMSVVVGDPLYRPYASWLQLDPKGKTSEWRMYHDFAVANASKPASEFRILAREAASRAKNGPVIEDLGLMEAKDGNLASAVSHFQQARTLYKKQGDILRVVLAEADSWVKQEKPKRALELVRSVLKIVPDGPTAALLKKIEQDNGPPLGAPQLKP